MMLFLAWLIGLLMGTIGTCFFAARAINKAMPEGPTDEIGMPEEQEDDE